LFTVTRGIQPLNALQIFLRKAKCQDRLLGLRSFGRPDLFVLFATIHTVCT
jgi:hypothetical protein